MADTQPTDKTPHQAADGHRPMDRWLRDSRRLAARGWLNLRPRLHQAALNVRVWAPVLSNRSYETRRVTYWAREHQRGMRWEVVLPEQCWRCATREGLARHSAEFDLRSFEMPLPLAGTTLAIAAVCVLWALLAGSAVAILVGLSILAAGAAVIWVKSWTEEVHLVMWSCQEHQADAPPPEVVADQGELYVFAATAELAAAAQAELDKERRSAGRAKHRDMAPAHDDDRPPVRPVEREGFVPPPIPDLPPIKLVDDDDIEPHDPDEEK